MTQGRENFSVMDDVTTFGKQNRMSISKPFAFLLVILFIGCLVGTGLLVYHLSSCRTSTISVIDKLEVCTKSPPENVTTAVPETTTTVTEVYQKVNKTTDVRLPRSIFPEYYDIKLIPFFQEGNFTFNGEVKIKFNVTENTKNITLHADELFIDETSINVYDMSSNSISIRTIENDTEKQFLIINLTKELDAGKQYTLRILFIGVLNNLMQGFYRSSYLVNEKPRWIAATQFQPTDARKAFPCFDEPALKAKFKITLARPKEMSTISNMPKISSSPVNEIKDYVWDYYQESVPISTYLVAFVVSDFVSLKNGNFSVWVRKDAESQARYSLEIGPKILKYFEDFFEIKYPLPKLDMIALPDFAKNGMENWGLVTYRESAMLYEKGVSSRSSLQRVTAIVAHELGHQWFGNLVTPKWWTDLWLNEGFANYMEFVTTDVLQPTWKFMDQFVVLNLQNVFALDVLKSSHPISIKVNNPMEINDIFDKISYRKGSTIIRMMYNFLTPEVFKQGLINYLKSRMYSSAEQDDLWHALSEEAHRKNVLSKDLPVKKIMDTWTLQSGFPLVTVSRSYETDSITFKQEKFSLETTKIDSATWWIPITYTTKINEHVKSFWMPTDNTIVSESITVPDRDWLLVNVNQTGYYRVNYDQKNWLLLTEQLLDVNGYTKFSTINRAQMLDDTLNLAAAGYLDYQIALNLTTYLINEKDYIPWIAAFINLDYIQKMLIKTPEFDKLKFYMTSILINIYKHVGFQDSPTDSHLTVYNRMEVLWRSCLLENSDCIKSAITHFYNWKSAPNADTYNPISPNLRKIVYCMAIRAGGEEEWDFAWERYLKSNVGSEKEIIMSALGCSREIWILNRYLYKTVAENSEIRKQDSFHVFTAVSNNIIGQELVYKFFKNHWNLLKKYLGSSPKIINNIVKSCISHINTQEELQDLKTFLANHSEELSIVSKTIQQSLEQVEVNIRWMNNNYNKIVDWLSRYQRTNKN